MDEKSEKLRIRISNSVDMLMGCKNRMCITDDSNELVLLYGKRQIRTCSEIFGVLL